MIKYHFGHLIPLLKLVFLNFFLLGWHNGHTTERNGPYTSKTLFSLMTLLPFTEVKLESEVLLISAEFHETSCTIRSLVYFQ